MSGSAYSVSARLNITGNYQQVFRQLGRSLTALDRQISGTEANLVRLMGHFPTLATLATRSATVVTGQMGLMRASVSGVTTAISGSNRALNTQASRLNNTATAARSATLAANNLANSMRALSTIPPPPRIPPPSRGGVGGGRGGGAGAGGGWDLDGWGRGYVGYQAARGAARTVGSIIEAGGTEQQAMTMLRAQGVSDEDRAAMREAAIGLIRQVPGSTLVEAIGAIRETRMALGPTAPVEDVNRAAPEILRAARLSAVVGGRSTQEGLRPLARFSAITGGFTDDQGERDIGRGLEQLRILQDAITAFSTGTGEGIDPAQWENFAKMGGIALRRMSHEGQAAMATLIQERGGFRSGTELTAFSNFVVSHKGPKANLALARERGLTAADPRDAGRANAEQEALIGRMLAEKRITDAEAEMVRQYRIKPGEFRGRGFAAVRPDIYVSEVFRPAAERRGFKTEEQQLDLAADVFPRDTSRRFMMAMLQVREVMEDILAFRMVRDMRASGQNPTGIVLEQGYASSLDNMRAGFTNLLTALGNAPSVIGLLNDTARGLNDLADVVRQNPTFMETAVKHFRDFVQDVRTLAEALGAVVSTLGPLIRSLPLEGISRLNRLQRGEMGVGEFLYESMDEQGQKGVDAIGDAYKSAIDFFRPNRTPEAAPTEAEPLPPSWGGPMPGAPRVSPGGIQLNNFQPMAPGSRETVVHTVVNLDGRLLTDVVSRHQERAAGAPTQGTDRYDMRRGAPNETVIA